MIDLRKLLADDDVISDQKLVALIQLINKNWIPYGIQIQLLVSIEGGFLLSNMNDFQNFSGKIRKWRHHQPKVSRDQSLYL